VSILAKKWREKRKTLDTSGDSTRSDHERHYSNDDVELGILENAASYPTQPPEAHRGSCGMASVYWYEDDSGAESMSRGFRHLRVEVFGRS
jgi:hypothetical protein